MHPLPRLLSRFAGSLLVVIFATTNGLATEPLVGDLPPAPADIERLLGADLDDAEAAALFAQVRALLIERLGDDEVSEADLWLGAVQGMIDVVNRESREDASRTEAALPDAGMVLDAAGAGRLAEGMRGSMTGIGVEFQLLSRPGILVVSRVLPESPADQAGILIGDRIVALDGLGFVGRTLPEVLRMLQGEAGSRVALQLQRGVGMATASFVLTVERKAFAVRSVSDELRAGGVGYIRVFGFHRNTPREVGDALQRLRELGADRIVLDLRDSLGGDLIGAAGVADLFLPEGTVLGRVVEPGVGERDLLATEPQAEERSLVVLVNAWTGGSAVAVATALQEHHRAYVIGEPTMGSAHTETLIDLGHELVLRLESVRLFSPTGRSWEGRGVLPDQPFWSDPAGDPNEAGAVDPMFEMAVHYLETEGL